MAGSTRLELATSGVTGRRSLCAFDGHRQVPFEPYFFTFRRSVHRFFIFSEMHLRASADMRRRGRTIGAVASMAGGIPPGRAATEATTKFLGLISECDES